MKHRALALQLSCVLSLISISMQLSTVESDHYVAAVLEYNSAGDTIENLEAYISYMVEAASQDVDIIVFPEATLNRADVVSVDITVEGEPAPCDDAANQAELLVELSCAARLHTMYVVVNLFEEMDCTESADEKECPERIFYRFNTNVVFDRKGNIIDRYRKINLFGEAGRTPSLDRALGVFETDFNVTFGHFICFDLMFQVPAVQVVQQLKITDIIFPTMWFSEGPFLTAVEIHEGYARALDVNFLAAGANRVAVGSGGTGIYSGSAGALVAYMPGANGRRMLVEKVPKVPGKLTETREGLIANDPADMDSFFLKQDQSIPFFASQMIEVSEAAQTITVTQGEVVCNFEILTDTARITDDDGQKYYYRAVAFDGVRTFDGLASGGSKLCAVLACTTQELPTCGIRFPNHTAADTTLFNRLSITATVTTPTRDLTLGADSIIYYPVSLQNNLLPLTATQLPYKETRIEENETRVSLVLEDPSVELLALGVWGRVFQRDGLDPTDSNSHPAMLTPGLLLITLPSVAFLRFVLAKLN